MNLTLAGYETKPRKQFQQELTDYSRRVAQGDIEGMPPTAATPVFADQQGRHFVGLPTDDGLAAAPFIPGSPASGDRGGFIAAESLPKARSDNMAALLGGVGAAIRPEAAAQWLGAAATKAALGGAPGTPLAAALASLGLPNPMAAGALGGAVAAAANLAGLGRAGSLLGGAIGGGPQGLANALGSQALAGLLGRTSLGGIPGMGALAGIAGGQLSNLAQTLTGGGWGAGLDLASGLLGGLLGGNGSGLDPGMMADNIVAGDGMGIPGMDPTSGLPDLESIGPQALDGAADMLLDQWQVDDESSAAEHVAHKMVNDNRDMLKEAAQDPDGLLARLEKLFTGESSTAVLPAARLKDTDATKPEVIAQGVATILAENEPISRITDLLSPSGALILEGSATVLSAGLPTARLTSKTDSPGVMIDKGAPTVLVGGPTQAIAPPESPPTADTPGNDGPTDPDDPDRPESDSTTGQDGGEGDADSARAENSSSEEYDSHQEDPADPTSPNGESPDPFATTEDATRGAAQQGTDALQSLQEAAAAKEVLENEEQHLKSLLSSRNQQTDTIAREMLALNKLPTFNVCPSFGACIGAEQERANTHPWVALGEQIKSLEAANDYVATQDSRTQQAQQDFRQAQERFAREWKEFLDSLKNLKDNAVNDLDRVIRRTRDAHNGRL